MKDLLCLLTGKVLKFVNLKGNQFTFIKLSRISIFCGFALLSSCYSSRSLDYLQSNQLTYNRPLNPTVYKLQPNDVLDIKIQSRDLDQVNYFNTNKLDNRSQQANVASLFLTGYPIDQEGNIYLAEVGELKVSGLAIEEVREMLQTEINKYLLDATVSVKMISFKISVMGDVKEPGTRYVYNTQSTIFEALSAAGDLNLSAKRKNVRVIRQEGNKSTVATLDLRDPFIISSPYYFVYPNDVIYVETSKQNIVNNNLGVFAVILSAITTGILIWDFVDDSR